VCPDPPGVCEEDVSFLTRVCEEEVSPELLGVCEEEVCPDLPEVFAEEVGPGRRYKPHPLLCEGR